ncbi:alginate lyase family protein [Pontibacter pamirensis]|uniref:alginate lyase family protein n=1 Tax=Pontibacter pamirensis TaxID=2562824 RepID=UPI001F3E5BEF|nr:alginate lyase family protein [Pontibacter pamirensis]
MNTIRLICRHHIHDRELLTALQAEVSFLSGRIEYHLLANHVLENAFALLMGGAFFDHDEWIEAGCKILTEQLKEQVLNDGGHYELSPMYHQIILYRLLELIDWYQAYDRREEAFFDYICRKATLMLGWLRSITFSSNEIPYLNDSAPFITYDTKSLIDYAANLKLNTASALALSESGYRKFERGSYECVVDVADIGPEYQAGHGHADALSFILHYKGAPVFVEAGTSTYEADAVRSYERSTAAHNTVVVNNTSQSEVWGSFRVGDRAQVTILSESENELKAEHDGYSKRFGVRHSRSFSFDNTSVIIVDEIAGRAQTEAVALFHLHPNVACQVEGNTVYLDNVGMMNFLNGLRVETATYNFSSGFNTRIPATVLKVIFEDKLNTQIELT